MFNQISCRKVLDYTFGSAISNSNKYENGKVTDVKLWFTVAYLFVTDLAIGGCGTEVEFLGLVHVYTLQVHMDGCLGNLCRVVRKPFNSNPGV